MRYGYWKLCPPTALVILLSLSGYEAMESEYNKSVVLFYQSKSHDQVNHCGKVASGQDSAPVQEEQTPEVN